MRLIFTIAVSLALAAPAAARDIYVNNVAGDDQNIGAEPQPAGEFDGPVRTIAKALRLATSGDRIVLADTGQPYREMLTLYGRHHSGTVFGPFIIEGNGAVLDGSVTVPPQEWEHVRGEVFRFRPTLLAYQKLFSGGVPVRRLYVDRQAATMPELEPMQWCLWREAIYFRGEPGRPPQTYPLQYAARPVGITLLDVQDVEIRDLVVQGFQREGIAAADGVRDARLIGVTARGNGRSGIAAGGVSRLRVEACLIGNNGEMQLRAADEAVLEVVASDVIEGEVPPWTTEGNGRVVEEGKDEDEEG